MKTQRTTSTNGRPIALLLLVWFAIAVIVGAAGLTAALRPPAPQVVILVLTVASLSAALFVPRLRAWADYTSLRPVVALHLTRFVGVYFLILARQGKLSPAFAIPAGWGDIAVATLAVCLLAAVDPTTVSGRRLCFAWNILGLVDILMVIVNAARVGFSNPASMQALLHLPLSLLPTFLVPVIVCSHILVFRRLRSSVPHKLPA